MKSSVLENEKMNKFTWTFSRQVFIVEQWHPVAQFIICKPVFLEPVNILKREPYYSLPKYVLQLTAGNEQSEIIVLCRIKNLFIYSLLSGVSLHSLPLSPMQVLC